MRPLEPSRAAALGSGSFFSAAGRRGGRLFAGRLGLRDELDLVAGLVFFVRHRLTSLPNTVMAMLTRLAMRSTRGMILS